MTLQLKICACALAALPSVLWAAEDEAPVPATDGTNEVADARAVTDPGFERYKTILDRMPFGPEPENFDPDAPGGSGGSSGGAGGGSAAAAAEAAAVEAEQQQILAAVRVSALNVTPSGKIAVGFTDNSKQPSANYYLKVGETRDGWTVKDADAAEQTVDLEKDGVTATVKLGEGTDAKGGAKGGGAKAPRGLARGAAAARGRLSAPAAPPGDEPPADAGGSPLARLRASQARAAAARQAEAKRAADAAAQAKAENEAERARVQEEREQQRQTLLQIQEELKQQREARQREQEAQKAEGGGAEAQPKEVEGGGDAPTE